MKLSFRSIAAIPCLVAVLAISGSAHASIVTNGDFSAGMTGWNPSGTGTTPGIGITAINLNVPNSTGYGDLIPNAPSGTSTAAYFVDDNALESISQTITLDSFSTYVLSFDLFATNSGAVNQFNFQLTDSVSGASSSFGNGPQAGDTSVPVGVWTPETLTFTTGAATSYNLAFNYTAGATPAKDVVLTDVSIDPLGKGTTSPVPEPSSIVLLGSGLLSAAGLVRRRFSK